MSFKGNIVKICASVLLGTALCACTQNPVSTNDITGQEPDSIFTPTFAKYFRIEYYPACKVAVVLNPWDSCKVMERHIITEPATNVVAGSCCHIALIDNIGCTEYIKGVCSSNLIYNPEVRENIAAGRCRDLGDSFSINFEPTAMLQPQFLFNTAFGQANQYTERIKDAGINVVNTVEWMEPDIMGRTEWIKFMAAFFDRESVADSVFNSVINSYDNLVEIATQAEEKPSILPGLTFKGTWYMPAGQSYMNQIFTDAAGSYFFSDNTDTGSIPLGMENVIKNFSDCDIWVGLDVDSYEELLLADNRLESFKAFRERHAYNKNKKKLSSGANDFWENGVVHPDWILHDMILILHPEIMDDNERTIFFKPLQ